MLMYRKDLTDKAGIKFAERPTWEQVREAAAKIHDPANGVYGICLRGKPGWGDNMAFLTTMVNSFGGQWFDMKLEAAARQQALEGRGHVLRRPADQVRPARARRRTASTRSWRCTTKASAACGSTRRSPRPSSPTRSRARWPTRSRSRRAPYSATQKGANWLWAWALAIPAGTKHTAEAQKFIVWATSKDYIKLVAKEKGWAAVPTGTRKSTYANPEFQKAAVFAEAEKKAIDSANPNDSTLPKSPYVGVQFAAIPEFQAIGLAVGPADECRRWPARSRWTRR